MTPWPTSGPGGALRPGRRASPSASFRRGGRGEAWLHAMPIPPCEAGSVFNHNPLRSRKVLLRRSEINRLLGKAQQKGYTLIPLRLYFRRGGAKIELAVARGKKAYDKREAIAKREAQRQIEKAVKRGPRGSDRR